MNKLTFKIQGWLDNRKRKAKDKKDKKIVKQYLSRQPRLTARDLVAQDAVNNQAYAKFVEALQKVLCCGQINPDGYTNFEWNMISHSVITAVTVREYYEKTVRILLFVNCSSKDKFNVVTVSVGSDVTDIPLEIPDEETDASFIYELAAEKANEHLVSNGYNRITF